MTEKWEYCLLDLQKLKYFEDKKKNKHGWKCSLSIRYMGKIQEKVILCVEDGYDENRKYYDLIYPENPWGTAIGLLGSFDWELVSVQHGNSEFAHLSNEAIAYFKRPIQEGRQTNEPKLSFPSPPERSY